MGIPCSSVCRTFSSSLIIFVIILFKSSIVFPQKYNTSKVNYPYHGLIVASSECQSQKVLQFNAETDWSYSIFDEVLNLCGSTFNVEANFSGAQFNKNVILGDVIICSTVTDTPFSISSKGIILGSTFKKAADFSTANFFKAVSFSDCDFLGTTTFRGAAFLSKVNFNGTTFHKGADFQDTYFAENASFEGARIFGDIYLSSRNDSISYDFTKVGILEENVHIILSGPTNLKLQIERFKHLALLDNLNYYVKKEIITFLKDNSFDGEGNTRERFELDYLFAKSTKYQEISTEYRLFKLYEFWKTLPNLFYDAMMGLGYRPFKIIYWMFGLLIIFTLILFFTIRERVNAYINRKENKPELKSETHFSSLVNCFYVTAGAFFGIRLNQDILTFFKPGERWRIILIWSAGLFMYFLFIYGAKTGAILGALKTLFA